MSQEALKLALVALDVVKLHYTQNRHVNEAMTAIKEALAQPEKEPVAYQDTADKCRLETVPAKGGLLPQRTWVGLTEEEITTSLPYSVTRDKGCFHAGALWAEAKLKEKNTP